MNLEYLKQYKSLYVLGHYKYDVDSYISSYLITKILNYFKIPATWAILDKALGDIDSNILLNDCIKEIPVIIDINKTDVSYFLVDHNDVNQSVKTSENVVGAFDHHLNLKQYNHIFITKRCCCSLGVYEEYKAIYPFTKEDKYKVFMAFLSDSLYTKSSRCTDNDIKLAEELGFSQDYESLFNKYFIFTDLTKGIKPVFNEGYKEYTVNGLTFASNYIKTNNNDLLIDFKEEVKRTPNNFLGIWVNMSNNTTIAYFKVNNHIKEFNYNFIASRGLTIINDILKYLGEN
ncbi:MAG: DHH family phosphoesterase [Bacilli bacterium]